MARDELIRHIAEELRHELVILRKFPSMKELDEAFTVFYDLLEEENSHEAIEALKNSKSKTEKIVKLQRLAPPRKIEPVTFKQVQERYREAFREYVDKYRYIPWVAQWNRWPTSLDVEDRFTLDEDEILRLTVVFDPDDELGGVWANGITLKDRIWDATYTFPDWCELRGWEFVRQG